MNQLTIPVGAPVSFELTSSDPLGPQHDEREPGYFRGRFKWTEGLREVQNEAILHPTVLDRFAAKEGVQHYYERRAYRPINLASREKTKHFFAEQKAGPPV